MKLVYKHYGNFSTPPIIIMHGLFGMLDNWQYHAKLLGEHFSVFTVDLRNHGRSPHSDIMTYPAMASDILEFCEHHHLQDIMLLGHSMGGKVAMQFAVDSPQLLSKLIVADIGPRAYHPAHEIYFKAFREIDFSQFETRQEADAAFAKYESNIGIRMFLLKNLERADKGFAIKANVPIIEQSYPEIADRIEIPFPVSIPTLFMRGEKSNYIRERDLADIQDSFPFAQFVIIKNAGHWLHAENQGQFYQELMGFLLK
ncbi:MAG: alpha/beta fold hydrolase [Bacteroidetes bacterium]|nr:alpha/beta fold hydrolase [Bacteroidota bacterium]